MAPGFAAEDADGLATALSPEGPACFAAADEAAPPAGLADAEAPVALAPAAAEPLPLAGSAAAEAEPTLLASEVPADTPADPEVDPTLLAGADEPPHAASAQATGRRHVSGCFTLRS